MIVLPIAAGILVGRLLDGAPGTSPYATIVLLILGITVAALESYRAMKDALKVIRRD